MYQVSSRHHSNINTNPIMDINVEVENELTHDIDEPWNKLLDPQVLNNGSLLDPYPDSKIRVSILGRELTYYLERFDFRVFLIVEIDDRRIFKLETDGYIKEFWGTISEWAYSQKNNRRKRREKVIMSWVDDLPLEEGELPF